MPLIYAVAIAFRLSRQRSRAQALASAVSLLPELGWWAPWCPELRLDMICGLLAGLRPAMVLLPGHLLCGCRAGLRPREGSAGHVALGAGSACWWILHRLARCWNGGSPLARLICSTHAGCAFCLRRCEPALIPSVCTRLLGSLIGPRESNPQEALSTARPLRAGYVAGLTIRS